MDIGSHHSAIPGHLTLISMLVGRKIKWDVATETIVGDAEASKLLSRPYRAPWKLAGLPKGGRSLAPSASTNPPIANAGESLEFANA